MQTTAVGRLAEAAAAEHLKKEGYKIVAQNWKTKVCEIDIVATKNTVVYFVEVKFRSGVAQGTGLEYIGPHKLHRMLFAAEIWVQAHNYNGDYRLGAISVSQKDATMCVEDLLEL